MPENLSPLLLFDSHYLPVKQGEVLELMMFFVITTLDRSRSNMGDT